MTLHFDSTMRRTPSLRRASCLAAVAAHDAQMDGTFVYAVRSTGIYCRPSCPSRRPRENQILFFSQPEDAEHAGYRACRRCHPREIRESGGAKLVKKVCKEIESHPDASVSLKNLGELTGLS